MNKIVAVKFTQGSNTYDFFNDLDVKLGDTVVCDTAYGLSVGTVVGLKDTSPRATKWIVDKVDLSRHIARSVKRSRNRIY